MPFVREATLLPFLHIAEEVGREAQRRGYRKLGITGTKYLMTGTVYPDALRALRIVWEIPDADDREGSLTRGEVMDVFAGVHNPVLVHIPPLVHHGFKCISTEEGIVINCPTEPYRRENPDEFRLPPHGGDIPYDWARKDG